MKYLSIFLTFAILSCQDPSLLLPDLSTGDKAISAQTPITFMSPQETLLLNVSSASSNEVLFVDIRDEFGNMLKSDPLLREPDTKIVGYLMPAINLEGIFTLTVRTTADKTILSQKILYSKESLNIKTANVLPVYAIAKGKSVLRFELAEKPKGSYWARFTLSNKTIAYKKFSDKVANLFFDTPVLPGTYEIKLELFPSTLEKVDDSIKSSISTRTNLIVTDDLFFSRKMDNFGPRFLYTNLYLFEGETLDWSLASDKKNDLNVNQFLSTNGDIIGFHVPDTESFRPISWSLLSGGIPARQLLQFSYIDNGVGDKAVLDSKIDQIPVLKLSQSGRDKYQLSVMVGSRDEKIDLVLTDQGLLQRFVSIVITESSDRVSGYLKINEQTTNFSFGVIEPNLRNFKDSVFVPLGFDIATNGFLLTLGTAVGKKLENVRTFVADGGIEFSSKSLNGEFNLMPVSQGESLNYDVPYELISVAISLRKKNDLVIASKEIQAVGGGMGKIGVVIDGKNLRLSVNGAKSNFSFDTMPLFAYISIKAKNKSNELVYTIKKNK